MKLEKVGLLVICLTLGFWSCNKDDGGDDQVAVVLRDRGEQQDADKDSIDEYLKAHYYNKSAFDGNSNPKIADLEIKEVLAGDNISSDADSLLINAAELRNITFAETNYEFYVLNLNVGGGAKSPTFADNIIVKYEGFTLDNEVFDSAVTPVGFDLTTLVPGWRKVLPSFNIAAGFVENNDGTVTYTDHGAGVMFLPSGLAYFASSAAGIPAYTSIAFKFELLDSSENDHDGDGIPSYMEDLNGDGEFTVNSQDTTDETDDDSDGDTLPNYFDADDDGDGVSTADEDLNNDGDPTNDDTDGDGIPNYLDTDDAIAKD